MPAYILCDYCDHEPFKSDQGKAHHLRSSRTCKRRAESARKRKRPSRNFDIDDPEVYGDSDEDMQDAHQFDGHEMEYLPANNVQPNDMSQTDSELVSTHTQKPLFIQDYPRPAGSPLRVGKTEFEEFLSNEQKEGKRFYGDFDDRMEWELGSWLAKNLGHNQIESFLNLDIVRTCFPVIQHFDCVLQCSI